MTGDLEIFAIFMSTSWLKIVDSIQSTLKNNTLGLKIDLWYCKITVFSCNTDLKFAWSNINTDGTRTIDNILHLKKFT